jgi:predicted RNA-binding Zn-ribbon protein involved in translation (DUF1610 family)
MKRLSELVTITDPAELAAELQARYVAWECPGCGRELSQRREFPVLEKFCPDCLNRGFRPTGSLRRSGSRAEALAEAGCPKRFLTPFLSRGVVSPFGLEVDALDWEGDPWAVGFLGDSDGGKTMIATELFWRRLPSATSAAWWRADALVNALFGSEGDEAQQRATAAVKCSLLLLDDIGWGTNGGAMERLFGVIAERHGEMLPTIWTSNKKWAELVGNTVTGAAFARRLADGWRVPVKGSWKAAAQAAGGNP